MSRTYVRCILFLLLGLGIQEIRTNDIPPLLKEIEGEFRDEETKLLDLTNKERKRKGVPPLKLNKTLTYIARKYSTNMASRQHLSHTVKGRAKDLAYRLKKSGYAFARAGENVGRSKHSLSHIIDLWMKSSGHRKNILNAQFKEIGIGIAVDVQGHRYFTQVFGASKAPSKVSTQQRRSSHAKENPPLPAR